MKSIVAQLEEDLRRAAIRSGISTWGWGLPADYLKGVEVEGQAVLDRKSLSGRKDLKAIAGFEPDLIFSFLVPYPLETFKVVDVRKQPAATQSGSIVPMAWGSDYHRVLHEKAQTWMAELKADLGLFRYKVCVDTTPLVDRIAAEVCGLGQRGRHGFLIHEALGTAYNIGVVLLEGPIFKTLADSLAQDQNRPWNRQPYKGCETCRACVQHCPTGALGEDGILNVSRCLSAITQKKDDLSEDEMTAMGSRLYGCDICQSVCPSNHGCAKFVESPQLPLLELLGMTKKPYKDHYRDTGFYWRGLGVMKRNALVILGNMEAQLTTWMMLDLGGDSLTVEIDGLRYVLDRRFLPLVERWKAHCRQECACRADK